jgi:hypothetical protein
MFSGGRREINTELLLMPLYCRMQNNNRTNETILWNIFPLILITNEPLNHINYGTEINHKHKYKFYMNNFHVG